VNLTLAFDEGDDSEIVGETGIEDSPRIYADVIIYKDGTEFCVNSEMYTARITTSDWNPGVGKWAGSFESRCNDGSVSHDVSGVFEGLLSPM
jgi:hypothetical protein